MHLKNKLKTIINEFNNKKTNFKLTKTFYVLYNNFSNKNALLVIKRKGHKRYGKKS